MVDASDPRLLLSREEVDRDLPRGVATNNGRRSLGRQIAEHDGPWSRPGRVARHTRERAPTWREEPPAARPVPSARRVVDASEPRLLLSREEVDRDLMVGVVTNAAATRVVHDAKVRLFGDDGDLSLQTCFERAGAEPPERLALALELAARGDEVAVAAVRVPGAPGATEACVNALVGRVRLGAEASGGAGFASREATVRLTVPVGLPLAP